MNNTPELSENLEPKVVELSDIRSAQSLLRLQNVTTQAGFTAERIPPKFFARRPILIDDGPAHDEHRKQLVQFFTPKALKEKHSAFIEQIAEELVADAARTGACNVDDVGFIFSVKIASQIVGLTESNTRKLAKRLEAFFRQPPVNHTLQNHGRTQRQWAQAARNALLPLLSLYINDVRPAIRARKKHPKNDIISHLLQQGFSSREIFMECLTYGTAGMVTTREFISMVMLHMLENETLASRFLVASEPERFAILNEIIRLEPPVAHLYRRVAGTSEVCEYATGTLVDVNVREANRDAEVFAPHPDALCPERKLSAAVRGGLSFGDGAHRCPGSHLALLETDVIVRRMLQAGARLQHAPERGFDTLVQGYQLRNFTVTFS